MMTADQIAARRALVTELDALKKDELCRRAIDIGLYPTITKARAVAADMLRKEVFAAHIAAEEVPAPKMMPGQEPYTAEEQRRLYALVDAAARADVTELEEVEGQVPPVLFVVEPLILPNQTTAQWPNGANLPDPVVLLDGVNLQNIPLRTDEGKVIQEAFTSPPLELGINYGALERRVSAQAAAAERRARKAAFRARQAGWV